MTLHKDPTLKEILLKLVTKNVLVTAIFALGFCIIFAPEIKAWISFHTGIPISHESTALTSIQQKLDAQDQDIKKNRTLRMDTVINFVKDKGPKIDTTYTKVTALVDMIRSTPTGQRMLREYQPIRIRRSLQNGDGLGNQQTRNFGHLVKMGNPIASRAGDLEARDEYRKTHPTKEN